MLIRITAGVVQDIFQASPARAQRILRHERDLYAELVRVGQNLNSPAGRRAIEVLGEDYMRDLARRVPDFRVNPTEARRIVRMYRNGDFFGFDEEVRRLIEDNELGQLIESDHLFEQRFHDAVTAGQVTLTRPRSGAATLALRGPERIPDIHALAVPKNEIYYYRIARQASQVGGGFRLAGLYPHVGPGSKTTQLARLIRPTFEPFYSLVDIANAHRFVLVDQLGMTPWFERFLLQDMADALLDGVQHNPNLARQLRREFGTSSPTQAAIVAYLQRGPRPTRATFRPDEWPFWGSATVPAI